MDPKYMEFPQDSHAGRRKRLWPWYQRQGERQDCLGMYTSCLLFELKPHLRILKMGLDGSHQGPEDGLGWLTGTLISNKKFNIE